MDDPTFSILTPIYKTGAYVPQTIESVLSQTRADWELLLMDNACPDGGAEPAKPYLDDPRITLRTRRVNEGAVGARNDLLDHARGRYIVQLDSDDWLEPGYLDAVGNLLDAQADVGIAAPDAHRFLEEFNRHNPETFFEYCQAPPHDDHERTVEHLIRVNFVPPPFTIRRTALEQVGGWDARAERIWDLALLIDVALAGWKIGTIREPLAVYRVRSNSTAFDVAGRERLDIRRVREEFIAQLLDENRLVGGAKRQAVHSLYRSRIRTAALSGDRKETRSAMWRYVRTAPSVFSLGVAIAHLIAPAATARRVSRADQPNEATMDLAASPDAARAEPSESGAGEDRAHGPTARDRVS